MHDISKLTKFKMTTYANSLGYRVKQLQAVLRQRMDEALAADGIATPQFAALSALREVPGATNAELARACFVTPQTMHRITTRLVEEGLLEVSEDPHDAKKRRLSLTRKAGPLLRRADRHVEALEASMIEGMDPDELERTGRHIEDCRRRLETTRSD